MSFYSGQHGELWIDGKKAAKVAAWSFSSSLTTLDTTSLEDTDKTSTPGVRSTTGNCSLFYYADDPADLSSNSASTLIRKVVKAGSGGKAAEAEAATLKLRVADGTTAGKFITGKVWLTSIQMSMAVGSVLSAEVAFEFDGAPTEVNL
jgi:hypothetical protein